MKRTNTVPTDRQTTKAVAQAIDTLTGAQAVKAEARRVRALEAKAAKAEAKAAAVTEAFRAAGLTEGTEEYRAEFQRTAKARAAAAEARAEAAEAAENLATISEAGDILRGGQEIIITHRAPTEYEQRQAETEAEARALRLSVQNKAEADAAEAQAQALAGVKALTRQELLALRRAEARAAYALTPATEAEIAKAEAEAETAKAAAKSKAAKAAEAEAPRFSYCIGARVSIDSQPAAPLCLAHTVAQAVAQAVGRPDWIITACYNLRGAAPEIIQAAARHAAKVKARMQAQRQGTPLQWRIYNAALACDWFQSDLFDLVGAAALALCESIQAPAEAAETAAALTETAAALGRLSEADSRAAAELIQAAEAEAGRALSENIDRVRRAAAYYGIIARAAAPDTLTAAEAGRAAAYKAIDNHLTDIRAIRREAKAPALSFEALDVCIEAAETAAGLGLSEYEFRRRRALVKIVPAAVSALTPTQVQTWRALYRTGGAQRAAARLRGLQLATVQGHIEIIARRLSEAVAALYPDSLEARELNLLAYAARTDAEAARARIQAARIEAKAARLRATQATEARQAAADFAAILADTDAATEAAKAEAAAILAAAYSTLTPAQREAARAAAAGLSERQAAAALGRSRAAIRKLQSKAAAALRRALHVRQAAPQLAAVCETAARLSLSELLTLAPALD